MAIFIASTKSISRGRGQSAVASASYRSGEVLEDRRYGRTHNYSKRSGVMSTDIILPSALAIAGGTIDRGDLWNKAESAEKRRDARVAREWLVNLPHELSEQDRKELAHNFAQTLANRYGTIADCAIHQPTQKEIERGADPRNFHAHIMFTTRCAELDDNHKIVLTDKATIELSDNKRRSLGLERVNVEIKEIRQLWEQIANEKLVEYNHKLIDSRSYNDQGKNIEPQIKMGSVATKLERDAYEKAKKEALDNEQEFTGIAPVTIRGQINAVIAERNRLVLEVSNKIERGNSERINRTQQIVNENAGRARDTESIIARVSRTLGEGSDRVRGTKSIIEKTQQIIDENTVRARDTKSASDWATRRCEIIPTWINGTSKASERTQRVIDENTDRVKNTASATRSTSERIEDSKSDASRIYNSITERTKPDPNPFDNTYERAFYERKRRINQKIRDAARQAIEVEYGTRRIQADTLDKKKVLAYRLLTRNHDSKRLRKGRNDKSERYPEKFDYRQIAILDEFAHSLGIHTIDKDHLERHELVVGMLSLEVMQNNLAAIDILIDKQKERSLHQTATADFCDFIAQTNEERAAQAQRYQAELGRNDTSRVTATIMTATPYLAALTGYANNSDKTHESRVLAEQHINQTIRLTAKQYEVAYKRLSTLMSNDSIQKHARALGDSLGDFTAGYYEKLCDDDLRSINEGLKVIGREIDVSNVNENRDDPSPNF